jgi:hypothetical protein
MSEPTQSTQAADPAQIGIGEVAHYNLERLYADKHFPEMRNAYKFAIAYALTKGARPTKLESSRKNVFSISTIDPDGLLRLAIETLYPVGDESPYRIAERLADWGVGEVTRLVYEEYKSIGDLLPDA